MGWLRRGDAAISTGARSHERTLHAVHRAALNRPDHRRRARDRLRSTVAASTPDQSYANITRGRSRPCAYRARKRTHNTSIGRAPRARKLRCLALAVTESE
jgi:hypothetical protein